MVGVIEVRRMSNGGRPRGNQEAGTRQTRLMEDLVEMISWVARIRGLTSATLLDPIIRPTITAMHKTLEADINRIKAAEAEAARRLADARRRTESESEAEQPGGDGGDGPPAPPAGPVTPTRRRRRK